MLYYLLVGLGVGGFFACLAQGVVVGYRGSGVINFAHGAIATYIAYTYVELRDSGRLVVPPVPNPLSLVEGIVHRLGGDINLPDMPTFVGLGDGPMPFWAAVTISMAVALLMGLLLHVVVFNPLRRAPLLAKVVAAVGVMLILQNIVALRFGTTPRNVEAILPDRGVKVLGNVIGLDKFLLAALSLVLAGALTVLYRRTRFGLATSAAAENEKGAILLGLSPSRQAALNWILATGLAGLIGILTSPITALTPTNFTFFIVPAIGAALLGNFTSFWLVTLAGLGLGMIDQLLVYLMQMWSWLPDNGVRETFPLLVIILAVVLRGNTLPVRGALTDGRLPFAPRPTHVKTAVLVYVPLTAVGLIWLPFDWRQAIMVSIVGVIVSLSLVVLTGFIGQISLAQMTIAGLAAFALTRYGGRWGIPFPLSPVLAALTATALGVVIGIPALRVRGVNLAVITMALAYSADSLVFNNRSLIDTSAKVPPPSLFGIHFGKLDSFFVEGRKLPNPGFGLFLLAVATVLCIAVVNLRRGSTGRRLLAVRSNERAAAAAGVSVMRTKLTAFAISSFIAGIAGVLIAYDNSGAVNPQAFGVLVSLSALATAYLGGISSVYGAIIAGTLILGGLSTLIADKAFNAGAWAPLWAGVGLVATAILNPEGIAGAAFEGVRAMKSRFSGAAPTPVEDAPAQPQPRTEVTV